MNGHKGLALVLASLLLVSSAAMPALAALNYQSGEAPNPAIEADVTVDSYNVSWGDALQYEDDSGDVTDLPAQLNSSEDHDDLGTGAVNPFTFAVTDVEFADGGEFPRKADEDGDNSASALDASEYTTSGATVSDVTTAPGVDAVEFAASTAGDSATYDNFSITSDAEKRYFQAFYDVESASGASTVEVTIHDATDGDTAVVELYNSSGMTSTSTVGANSTGDGKAIQVQVGQLSATGGDNTIDEIGKLVISADGAANVDISTLNVERTSQFTLGERYVDNDDDDELETETIYQATGPVDVWSVNTLGAAFDDATIHGLTFPAEFDAASLDSSNVNETFAQDNAYPQWAVVANLDYRLSLPSAYDLSYANVDLVLDQMWPTTRYASVEIAEDTGDTDFADIDSSAFADVTSSLNGEGEEVSLDSTVSVGTNYVVSIDLKLTDDEASAMQAAGGAGPMAGSDGGFIDSLLSLPGIIISGIVAFVGGRRLGVF